MEGPTVNALEVCDLTPQVAFDPMPSPAANADRNDVFYRRVPAWNFRKCFFYHPVKHQVTVGTAGIGDCRKGMDDIAQR